MRHHRRLFGVEQANALIPAMRQSFAKMRPLRSRLESIVQRLEREGHPPDPQRLELTEDAPAPVRKLQKELLSLVKALDVHVEQLQELGLEVRAADGLVDFYSRYRGRIVCLCWSWEEDEITHYRELESGYHERKPIRATTDFEGDLLN